MLYAVVLLMDNKLDCLDLRSEVNLLLVSSGLIFTTGHLLGLEGSLSSFPCDVKELKKAVEKEIKEHHPAVQNTTKSDMDIAREAAKAAFEAQKMSGGENETAGDEEEIDL